MEQKTIYINQPQEVDATPKETSIPKDRWGVHETHCCKKHGCKYGNRDCPVELGLIEQRYACEFGDEPDDTGCFNPILNLIPIEAYVFTREEFTTFIKSIQDKLLTSKYQDSMGKYMVERTINDKKTIIEIFDKIINES